MARMLVLLLGLLYVPGSDAGWGSISYINYGDSTHPTDGLPVVGDVQTGRIGMHDFLIDAQSLRDKRVVLVLGPNTG